MSLVRQEPNRRFRGFTVRKTLPSLLEAVCRTLSASMSSFASLRKRLDDTLSSRAFWRASSKAAAMSSGLGTAMLVSVDISLPISEDILHANHSAAEPSMQRATCQTVLFLTVMFMDATDLLII